MQKSFTFQLGKRAYRCPACGRKTFKRYETATGAEIADDCGRCNREVNCRYHMPPRQWYAAHGGKPLQERLPLPPPPKPVTFVADSLVRTTTAAAHYPLNPLYRFLTSVFAEETVRAVFADYGVGFAMKWGGSAVFWQRDQYGNVRAGKIMAYDPETGHRVKTDGQALVSWAHRELKLDDFVLEQCFFGAHLATAKPDARILMVESEKTAVILACELRERGRDDDYVVLASGGASNIQLCADSLPNRLYRFRALAFRKVTLIPDADMKERWTAAAEHMRLLAGEVAVFDIGALGASGSDDIGDIILRAKAGKPPLF